MTLWNIIRDFFVQYVFGGVTSNGQSVSGNFFIGNLFAFINGSPDDIYGAGTDNIIFNINGFTDPNYDNLNSLSVYMSLGDYLSTTATIIVLVVLAVVVALGIRWLFRFLISRFTKWGL